MIFEQFEREGDHRRSLERRDAHDRFVLAMCGVICAVIIALTGLIGGVALVANGYDAGYLVSLVGVGAIVASLVYGTRHQRSGGESRQ